MLVKAIKLISGEELVGEVVHEEKSNDGFIEEISMKNPLAIVMGRQQDGNLSVGFVPFAPYLGKNVTFDFPHTKIIFVKDVDTQMKDQYTSIFTGLVVPPKTLLVG